jgi:hypothetical protein
VGLVFGAAVWVLLQVGAPSVAPPAAAGFPSVIETPWPAVLPCAHPRSIWFDGTGDPLVWASADGGDRRSYAVPESKKEWPLSRDFPTGHLTRLSLPHVGSDLSATFGGVGCPGGADVTWGPSVDGIASVSATYRARPLPKSRERTRHWTDEIPGSPWADIAPDVHWTRFLRDVARKKAGDPTAIRESMRFTRAFAGELRDVLAAACGPRRCAEPARDADGALAAYLRDPSPAYANAAQRRVDNWNYEWTWTATGGGVSLRLSCDDMTESRDLLCDLALDLPGEIILEYGTFHRWVELYAAGDREHRNRLGAIADVSPDRGPGLIAIDGRLLALSETPAPKQGTAGPTRE